MVKTATKANKIIMKPVEKPLKVADKPALMDNDSEQTIAFIKNKKAYRIFLKLVKENKFTTGLLAAQITGVSRQTIATWLNTPKIKTAMNLALNRYVENIESSKDWKASAYLIDKVTGSKDEANAKTDLSNLIQINIQK